jgi:hypothetical protein
MEPFVGILMQGKTKNDYEFLMKGRTALFDNLVWWAKALKAAREKTTRRGSRRSFHFVSRKSGRKRISPDAFFDDRLLSNRGCQLAIFRQTRGFPASSRKPAQRDDSDGNVGDWKRPP